MLIAASLIASFNVLLGIASFLTRQKRKNWEQENVVYLPFYLAGVGIVCGTILSIPTVACAMDGDWMFAFFGVVVLACDCMMAAYLNCVIRYDDKGFIAQARTTTPKKANIQSPSIAQTAVGMLKIVPQTMPTPAI